MSNTSTKKKFGFFAVIVAAVLCLAAGAYYKYVNGYFGLAQSSHKDNFSPVVFWLLIGVVYLPAFLPFFLSVGSFLQFV